MNINILQTERVENIQKTFHLSSLCARVLASKKLQDEEITELLKEPELTDPFKAKGVKEIVDRLYEAKVKQEKVLVCGDYDADGICSTTILYDALQRYGISCGFYIPNRFKEGYGLQTHTVEMADEKGYSLLITVDNGVKAFAALQEAAKRNLDVIVTDHHTMDESFPCLYLLHPFEMGEQFHTLSGAGVALILSRALLGEVKEHVVLACVAAIADVMPLWKETRDIVKLGIQYLKQGICQPVQMLVKDRYPQWDETLISFQVVPKLNTTGRLADMVNANNTVRYLMLQNLEEIQKVSKQIHELNERRKVMSNEMVMVAKSLIHPEYKFQLLFHESFHEGMAGLVAGKLSDELQQPVMVAAQRDTMFKGSIRSGGMLDLTTFFDDCQDALSAYGGHKAAAGIGFPYEKKQYIQDYVNEKMEHVEIHTDLKYDVIQGCAKDLTIQEVESLTRLAPFGCGFKEPLLYFPKLPIQSSKILSNGMHMKWSIDEKCDAMYFHCSDQIEEFSEKKSISFIGTLSINAFMGRKKVNIFVTEAF